MFYIHNMWLLKYALREVILFFYRCRIVENDTEEMLGIKKNGKITRALGRIDVRSFCRTASDISA